MTLPKPPDGIPLERLAQRLILAGCCARLFKHDTRFWLGRAGVHVDQLSPARLLWLARELAALLPERPVVREPQPKRKPAEQPRIEWTPERRARHSNRLKAARAQKTAAKPKRAKGVAKWRAKAVNELESYLLAEQQADRHQTGEGGS